MTRALALMALVGATSVAGCLGLENTGQSGHEALPSAPPKVPAFEPVSVEEQAGAKRVAARVAQRALTYPRGATPEEVARSLVGPNGRIAGLAKALRPAVRPGARSWGRVVYPQLSGLTATTLGTIVVVRQVTEDADGRRQSWTRAVDVRLRRSHSRWTLDRLASVGGSPVKRPDQLSQAAQRVVEHPNIDLPDSARWDIYRGRVDESLLSALADAADRYSLAISVFASGHPANVWATTRTSAHTAGLAADIYKVQGRLVIEQREADTPAFNLTRELLSGGAIQIGSPWIFAPGGSTSFSDATHQDHIHLQQSAAG